MIFGKLAGAFATQSSLGGCQNKEDTDSSINTSIQYRCPLGIEPMDLDHAGFRKWGFEWLDRSLCLRWKHFDSRFCTYTNLSTTSPLSSWVDFRAGVINKICWLLGKFKTLIPTTMKQMASLFMFAKFWESWRWCAISSDISCSNLLRSDKPYAYVFISFERSCDEYVVETTCFISLKKSHVRASPISTWSQLAN